MGSRWYLLRPVRVPGGTPRCALIPRALLLSRKTTARCFGGLRRPSIRTTSRLRVPTVWGWAAEAGQEPPTLGSTPPVPRQLLTLVPHPAPAVLALLLSFGLLVGALPVHAAQGLPVLIAEWQHRCSRRSPQSPDASSSRTPRPLLPCVFPTHNNLGSAPRGRRRSGTHLKRAPGRRGGQGEY